MNIMAASPSRAPTNHQLGVNVDLRRCFSGMVRVCREGGLDARGRGALP